MNSLRPASATVPVVRNVVLAGILKATIDKLQRLLNAAARLVNDTRRLDRGLD